MRPVLVLAEHDKARARLYGQMLMLPAPPLTFVATRGDPRQPPWPPGTCLCGIEVLCPSYLVETIEHRFLQTSWPAFRTAYDDATATCGTPPVLRALPPLEVAEPEMARRVARIFKP